MIQSYIGKISLFYHRLNFPKSKVIFKRQNLTDHGESEEGTEAKYSSIERTFKEIT